MEFRQAMRPGYGGLWHRGRGRPVGIFPDRYARHDGHVWQWHWSCRLDCWAALTSGWYLRSRAEAFTEAQAHLRAFHFPEACTTARCTERHVDWPVPGSHGSVLCRCHLRGWQPVAPLLHEQVTLRA
jgi:hypothetical protein